MECRIKHRVVNVFRLESIANIEFFEFFSACFGGFVSAVPIHVAWDVFSEFQFRFRVSVGGAGGLSLRAESVGLCFA